MVRSLWSIRLEDKLSGLPLGNNAISETGNIRRLLKLFFIHTLKVPTDLVAKTVVQVGQLYASRELVLTVSQGDYVPGGIVPSLMDQD